MRKSIKKACALVLAGTMILQPMPGATGEQTVVNAAIADEFVIPAANANGTIGATVPYTRYDSTDAMYGGGATLGTSQDWAKENIATQASEQSYVRLPGSGAYAEWKMKTTGNGVTMRFTMPDSSDGMGLNGSLDVYVNGTYQQTINLTSYYMWQYFPGGSPSDTPGGTAAFAFDEVHFKLNKSLKKDDIIRIQSSGASGLEYGVDFLEIEEVPEAIEQPDNSVSVTDFGASPDDGIDDLGAIRATVEYADARGMDVYFPEGTFHLSGMWNLYCSDMMITGAGMWYTNLQFTSDKAFGGGIAGGNGSNGGPDGYCTNLEFCNMYINSNLRSRYHEQAVYKCFMDIFGGGSVIHDVWEEHFECGFWFGDYNGAMDYCDGVKVVDCRIRNNLADGVNFCQGTSNATVYNCNIRNNGDDGLAMWNNHYMNAKDESNNVFAYNTLDLSWRAGAIAIYGGNGHKVYNNYICDTYMASGIHLNTTFSGYTFSNNTSGITFDNNILVRCGTNSDAWGEDLSAIDIKQSVANITFNNTQIYDSPFTAIRLLNDGFSGITFNNTKILGAGLSGQDITFSCNKHSGVAIRESASSPAVFNGLEIGGIAPDKYANDAGQKNTTWPYWTDRQTPQNIANNSTVTLLDSDVTYVVPGYPDPVNKQTGGVVDPLEGITGYDVIVSGVTWKNEKGSTSINEGDKVSFTAAIMNNSNVDIPEGVSIGVKFTLDDAGSYSVTSYKGGLKAGEIVQLTPTAKWTATAGGHTLVATADHQNKLYSESNENNNTRTKRFNAMEVESVATYTPVSGGYDLVVTDISWGKNTIAVGEQLVFTATVVNAGDVAVPSGTTIGIQFQVNGNTSDITWCDSYNRGLAPGASVQLTCNGGTDGNTWTATEGNYSIMGWVDDTNRLGAEVNENNNKTTINISVPDNGIVYIENPDRPDDLGNPDIEDPTEEPTEEPTTEVVETAVEMEINGFQISATAEGFRTVYSVNDPKAEVVKVGMVYGLASYATETDMYVGSANNYVYNFDATQAGKLSESFSGNKSSTSYAMTMQFNTNNADFFTAKTLVRAYAQLANGKYVYSDVYDYTIYDVAEVLYQGCKMSNYSGHEFLYTDVLSVVKPNYAKVDYIWGNVIVSPDEIA